MTEPAPTPLLHTYPPDEDTALHVESRTCACLPFLDTKDVSGKPLPVPVVRHRARWRDSRHRDGEERR